eukprot:GDKJ01015122.1.p1 GENE.GDKJ01015122.1~~GDKJ01015122.1.p1  ORF type:complete len:174 (-),score=33.08 GDKJ01015122.1:725-1246(-)
MSESQFVQGRPSIPPPSPKVGPLKTPGEVPGIEMPRGSFNETLDNALTAASAPTYGGFNTWAPVADMDALDEGENNEDQYAVDDEDFDGDDMDIEMEGMNRAGRVSNVQTGGFVFGKSKAVDQQPKSMFVRSEDTMVGGSMSLNTRNATLMAQKGGFCGSPLLSNVMGSLQHK